jgi:hypothetical protein
VAYSEVLYDLKTEWFKLLNGISLPVYKDSVPINQITNYVLIRAEGSTDTGITNSGFFRSAVIVVEINCKNPTIGNSVTAYQVAQEISDLILLSPNTFGITLTNHQITQITLQSEDELYEDDGSTKIFRVIKRYEHCLNQK